MNLKRLKIKILRFIKYLDANNIRYRLPKNLNQSQRFSIGIFFKVLKNQSTELYYDLITGECYLSNNEKNVYKNKILDRVGVTEQNNKTLSVNEKKMTGIKNYLNNPLEFWGGK